MLNTVSKSNASAHTPIVSHKQALSCAKLNDRQKEAVSYIKGPLLIVAGAGSGKTSVITHKIAHLVTRGYNPNRILAVTFTKDAAEEMRHRASALVNRNYNSFRWISTFHSFGVKFLRKEHLFTQREQNFTIYDETDAKSLVNLIVKTIKKGLTQQSTKKIAKSELNLFNESETHNLKHLASALPQSIAQYAKSEKSIKFAVAMLNKYSPADYLGLISIAKQKIEPDRAIASISKREGAIFLEYIYKTYNEELLKNNAFDFDDLILWPFRILESYELVRERWQGMFDYIMIDEFQDTNETQAAVIDALAMAHNMITVVGDPQQSIYGFRGAKPENILRFSNTYKPKIVKLETNYRSANNILCVANSVLSDMPDEWKPYTLTLRSHDNKKGDVVLESHRTAYAECVSVAERIKSLTDSGGLNFSDIVVLVRTRFLIPPLEGVFLSNRIPYTIVGGQSFFHRTEIKDLIAYLRFIVNPSDYIAFERVINKPHRQIGAKAIDRIRSFQSPDISLIDAIQLYIAHTKKIPTKTYFGLYDFLCLYDEYRDIYYISPSDSLSKVVDTTKYLGYIASEYEDPNEAKKRTENVRTLIEILAKYETLDEFFDDLLSMADKASPNTNEVKIMTIHNSKGLEFPVVFMPAIEEGIIPINRSSNNEDVDEERRLFYVAITRAKQAVYASHTENRQLPFIKNTEASRFVKYFNDGGSVV